MMVALLFFMFISTPLSAYAYLDPGSGSLLIQLVLGGVAGLLVIGKLYFRKIKSFFGAKEENKKARPRD